MRKSLLAAILFAGCGGSSPQPKTTTVGPSTPETTATAESTPTSTPATAPVGGGEAIVPTPGTPPAPAKGGAPELGTWGFDLKGMNAKVTPGQSFYQYANGTWLSSTPIPEDKSNYGMFTVLDDLSRDRTRTIIDEQSKDPNSRIGAA